MSKILVVDDEPNMRLGLKDNLEFEGFEVDQAENGDVALNKILNHKYDLVVLDVMMPVKSGFEVCRTVREKGISVPIILLTAKGEEIDKVLGLELGADDYVTKPFSLRELIARIKAVLRRKGEGDSHDQKSIKIGNLSVDFVHYTASVLNEPVKMSHKEFEILHYLCERKNEVVSRFDLLENVWGYDESPTTRTVDNFIVKLRNKIELNPNDPKFIITVHGTGYKLVL